MPPKAAHVAGTLFLCEREVFIVAGRFEAWHRRPTKDEPPAPLPEHRAGMIAAVRGARAKLYGKRQQLLNLGRHALEVITEVTHRERIDSPRMFPVASPVASQSLLPASTNRILRSEKQNFAEEELCNF
ncbi:MAG: hypothetical protein R3B13_37390 [Polyangiaceae bacterium]